MRNSATAGLQKPAIMQKFPGKSVLNNTTTQNLVNGNQSIEVFPPAVFFKDIEPNQNYEVTVTVRNITKKVRRIKFTQPKNGCFRCEYENQGTIAAGLSMKINVQFETTKLGDYEDVVEILTEGESTPFLLRVSAFKPGPDIQFEPMVNFKYIPVGQERTERIVFKNEGKQAGYVSLVEDPPSKAPCRIEPSKFNIEPDEFVHVSVSMFADRAENVQKKINVNVDGAETPSGALVCTGTCVDQHLAIVFEEGGGQRQSLNFGTMYMGERREYPAFLVNNGPQPAAFKLNFVNGLRDLEEEYANDSEAFISPADVGKELVERTLTVEPLSGVVGPYEQLPVNFICRPKRFEKKEGFSDVVEGSGDGRLGSAMSGATNEFGLKEAEDYATLAVMKFQNGGGKYIQHHDLKVQMMGRACQPDVKINKQTFQFGEVPQNERRDMVLSIRNKNSDLPLDFNFTKVANFRAVPGRGKLLPGAEHTINVSFEPKNFGVFNQDVQLEVLKGLYKIPIKVQGRTNTIGKKERVVRGPGANKDDFEPNRIHIEEDEANQTIRDKLAARKVKKPDAALAKMSEAELEANAHQVATYINQKQNRGRFNEYVKHERTQRTLNDKIVNKYLKNGKEPPRTFEDIEKDPDLGMDALEHEPRFDIVKDVDSLYVEKPVGKYEPSNQNLVRIRARKDQVSNRIVKKKFKPEPTTQQERKDCEVDLTGEQLQKISAGPQKINYKNVFVKSSATTGFNISNDLRQNIYVRVCFDQYPELQQSHPLSQCIPAGQEAGFDIVFCSQKPKHFNAPVTYYINDRPFTFLVTASADPVTLELSKKVVKFQFNDDSMDMSATQTVHVTNHGNAPARFNWIHPSSVFVPRPLTDVVPPGEHVKVEVVFNPAGPRIDDEILMMQVQDGQDEELRCQGTVAESRCAFMEKNVDFGNVHIGLKAKDHAIHIKNQMRTAAIFHVEPPHPELTVYPMKGKIPADQKFAFTVGFTSPEQIDFQSEIVVNIRGGKQLRLPVRASVIRPDVFIQEKNIDFGGVTYGDQKMMSVTVVNNSDISAKLTLDIRDYPEFELILPPTREDDDVHSEICQPYDMYEQQDNYTAKDNVNPDDVTDPEGDDQSAGEESSEYDDDTRRHVRLSIRPALSPFELKLKYTPAIVEDPKKFILPLRLVGYGETDGLTRRITAVGKKPRFFCDPTIVNFKTKVISKGQKPLPFHSDIQISNPDVKPIKWRIDKDVFEKSRVFQMNPVEGVLEAGSSSTVRVTFNPLEPEEYVLRVPLFLDDEKDKAYLEIEFRGEGADAKIYFDRREVILPTVPLDIESKAKFLVLHNGYENQQLNFKIANEVGKLPIKLNFPDGRNLGVTKQKVHVEASFTFTSPLSFTTFIDFFDDEGNKFSIPISGTTDNSVFTTYGFQQRESETIVLTYGQGKPIRMELDAGSDDEGEPQLGRQRAGSHKGASSLASRTAQSLVGYNPVSPDILERNSEYLMRWYNNTMQGNPMQSFPSDIIQQNGSQIFELIQFLSGKKAPGQATMKALATATQNNAKDALRVILNQYEEVINYLKVNGAHLNTVRPEYLLAMVDYQKFLKLYPKDDNFKQKTVERVFPYLSAESWVTVLYQILRIYYLNRITPKNFKTLPGMSPQDAVVDPTMTKSNVYSVSETILLKWMSYHYNLMNPMHGVKQVTNFDSDLADSTVFAALIRSHYGDPPALKNFRNVVGLKDPRDHVTILGNARMIIQAIEEIGISTHITAEDITQSYGRNGRELLLFCVQLYQSLPHYIPKATIEFPAVLGDLVTKNIELSNPSKSAIAYNVKNVGSDDFTVESYEVRIEPGQTIAFPVRFQSRISTLVKGKVIFTNRKEGNVQAAAMVFELVSNVYERNSVEIIMKSTKLYKSQQIDLQVENGFPSDVMFNVQVLYERAGAPKKPIEGGKGAAKGGAGGKDKKGSKGGNSSAGQPGVPDPFYCKMEHVKIRKNNSAMIPIIFLPFELGIHKCHIIFTDENVGEVQYTIVGKAELPEILDTWTGDCNSEEPYTFKKIINFKNDRLEQAKNQIAEKEKKDQKAKRGGETEREEAKKLEAAKKMTQDQPQKLFEIEISNPFFSGPQNITLFDPLAANKALGKPGQKDSKQSLQAQQQQLAGELPKDANNLELNCNPTKPASYTCYVILKSLDRTDIRLYEYKLTAIPQKIKAQLEFRVPARGQVQQDIPIVNNSSQEWKVLAHLEQTKDKNSKGEQQCFSLNRTSMLVKKKATENFSLTFKPSWVCEVKGTLTLKNESTKEEYEYELKGYGEEPLAEDHIVLTCNAREKQHHVFSLENKSDKLLKYTVWTDLQNAVGKKEIEIKPKSSMDYDLEITPLLGGVYTASITFQDQHEHFVWWTVEVRTESPKPEAIIDLRAFIRKATSAEISLSNPLNEPITFEVFFQGEGLIGDPIFSLEPKSVGTYNLVFSPLVAGELQGNIGFLNEKVGEFWYDLNLIAEENPEANLQLLECELGKIAHHFVELENPTGKEHFLDFKNSNPTNFDIIPDKIVLPPFETVQVRIQYSPTNLDVIESGNIIFENPQIGKWRFYVEGKGLIPTMMEPQPISTAVNSSTSSMLSYKNPFKEATTVEVFLKDDDNQRIFALLLKRNKFNIGPLGTLQIPYSFSPETMTESRATIVVKMTKQLQWRYPLRGIAESTSNVTDFHFKTRARKPLEDAFEIELPGFEVLDEDDTFHHELTAVVPAQQKLVDRSVQFDPVNNKLASAQEPLQFAMRFEPLKPFKAQCELIIYKSSGGRWKFNVVFEASEPMVDDIIAIQSPLQKTSTVSFRLTNHMKQHAEFTASFTEGSATEFQVTPQKGLLEPYGKDGTNFMVSFTPTVYGKPKIGTLVIQTDEMQWTYEIRGSHPHYKIPEATGGRLNNRLSAGQKQQLKYRGSEKKNFMRTNLNATKYANVDHSRDHSPLKQLSQTRKSRVSAAGLGGSPGSNKGKSRIQGDSPSRASQY